MMNDIIGVKFRPRGKVTHCDPGELSAQVNDYVIVESGDGPLVARVVSIGGRSPSGEQPMRVLRHAQAEEVEEAWSNLKLEALSQCREMAVKFGLQMKPLVVHYDPRTEHLTIFFSAEDRVDFRELVRKLSHELQTRVELRQAGARDEAKLLGCVGRCGYGLCCQNFLASFASVSIKMAKEQSLALNPMKISGICGRLLCCLAYESKDYAAVKKKMPQLKHEVLTPRGKARVLSTNLLKETVTVQFESGVISELALGELVQ